VTFDEFAIAPSAAAIAEVRAEAAAIIKHHARWPGVVNRTTKERPYCKSLIVLRGLRVIFEFPFVLPPENISIPDPP
jgi:hypothetical protein